jgi:hypothetical protein
VEVVDIAHGIRNIVIACCARASNDKSRDRALRVIERLSKTRTSPATKAGLL